MRYYIIILLTLLLPVCTWGQFNPNNPDEPSMTGPNPSFQAEVYKNGVVFQNTSRNASRFEWSFGDGTTSKEKSPEYTYAAPGNYTVTLTAYNGMGSSTYNGYITISQESGYMISGNFTLDPDKNGVRNFQSLDDLFEDLLAYPISDDVTITAAQDLDLSLSELKRPGIVGELTEKLAQSPYKVRLSQEEGPSTSLHLWDEFNKETYNQLEQLVKYLDCYLDIYLGNKRFYVVSRDWLFEPKAICYGNQSSEIWFNSYSDAFTYEWQLAETPAVGLTGYQESGTGEIPPMSVANSTSIYQSLVYNVSLKYQGEVYGTERVTFWVYPQAMYLNLSEPSDDGLIADPDKVDLSWEAIPGNRSSYSVYIREKENGDFDSKGWTYDNKCHINNSNNFFKFNQTYEWYVETWPPCGESRIQSATRTFTIGSAADLEITEVKVEPQIAVSGKELKITATVTNIGSKAIESGSWTDQLSCTNHGLSSQSQGHDNLTLAVNESYELSFTTSAPYSETLESLKFQLDIDKNSLLRELSKNNNRKEIEVPLVSRCIPEEEYQVLCELYNQAGGANWYLSRPWNITTPAVGKEGWDGVTLDEDGHVLKIELPGMNLVGKIPAGLFSLPYLETLDLSNNTLTGQLEEIIPDDPKATKLVYVDLGQNQFSGTIPVSVNKLTSLNKLSLGGNRLEAVEEGLNTGIQLDITGQTLPVQDVQLLFPLKLELPGICLYEHSDQAMDKHPILSVAVPGIVQPMILYYNIDAGAYRFSWDSYYHYINLPPNLDLTFTQTDGSAKDSKMVVLLKFPQGDANMDAKVDVEDIRHTLNFITNDNNSSGSGGYLDFNYYAANTYQEEGTETLINVQDLVATVNILLDTPQTTTKSSLRSSESGGMAATLRVEEGKLMVDNLVEPVMDLDITLKNVTSKQIKLLLPEAKYLYRTRDVEGGVRFVLVCMDGSGIPLGKTDILKVNGKEAAIAHAHLTNSAAHEVPSTFVGKELATGNESLLIDGGSGGGIRIDADVKTLVVSVYDMGGRSVSSHRIQEVVPGNYDVRQWLAPELPAGVYLVHIELHKADGIKKQTIKVSLAK